MVWIWAVVAALLVVVVVVLAVRRQRAQPAPLGRATADPAAPTGAGPAVLGAAEPDPPIVTTAPVMASVETTSTDPELLLEEKATAPAEREPPASVHGGDTSGPVDEADGDQPVGTVEPPTGFTVKGNVGSMLYHTPDSPYFARTRAEVWFNTEDAAREAGFTRWDQA